MTTVAERIQTQQAQAKPQTAVAKFSGFMDGFKTQVALALPAHLNSDRFTRLVLTAFSTSPALQDCEPRSILSAVMVAAQMGLEIGVSGQGWLIPYKKTCTFVPGWQGIVDIVNRSGRATVWTGAVFDGDSFDFALGDSPFVRHQPCGEDDPKKLTHVYAIGKVRGNDLPVIEVWPMRKCEKHFKAMNKVGERHYAHKHWEMYCRKLPLLQVCKYMPKSIELASAIDASHAHESGAPVTLEGDFVFAADPESGTKAGPVVSEPTVTYAGLAERLKKAKTRDAADLILDEARALPAEQYDEFVALADKAFPRG